MILSCSKLYAFHLFIFDHFICRNNNDSPRFLIKSIKHGRKKMMNANIRKRTFLRQKSSLCERQENRILRQISISKYYLFFGVRTVSRYITRVFRNRKNIPYMWNRKSEFSGPKMHFLIFACVILFLRITRYFMFFHAFSPISIIEMHRGEYS